jgi:putative oxidoreductase
VGAYRGPVEEASVKRSLPGPVGDVALLVARVLLGVIMIAHGYQKLVVDGIGRTTAGFESMSIPVAIVSASFVTVVELVGGVLLVLGLMTRTVAGCMGFVMAGAAGFVHVRHGVFVAEGGWELVGSIAGALLALAVAGPGRFGLAHLLRERPPRPAAAGPPRAPASFGPEQEVIPPAGLPVTPLIRLGPDGPRPAWPARFPQPVAGPPPVRPPGPPLRHL